MKNYRRLLAFIMSIVCIVSFAGCDVLLLTDDTASSPSKVTGSNGFNIHMIDIGQGDSILLECDGSYMLIDAGENDKGGVVVDYLKKHNISKLDYALITHPHSDHYGGFKTVRAVKNRFGSTTEVAIFEMAAQGLVEVKNPSEALLSERQNTDGSIIMATIEGARPLLVEIQALVNPTNFGYPKRTASGFDLNRLNLLIAVLEKRTKLSLQDKDIFINVVGGMRLNDSAADLAICMAIASAAAGRKLNDKIVVFGEVGLGGEIRSVIAPDRRIAEAKKLGFDHAIAPATIKDKFVLPVKDLRSALVKYMNNK